METIALAGIHRPISRNRVSRVRHTPTGVPGEPEGGPVSTNESRKKKVKALLDLLKGSVVFLNLARIPEMDTEGFYVSSPVNPPEQPAGRSVSPFAGNKYQ